MQLISRLEQEKRLDKLVAAGQRAARLIRPGKVRDGLNGVWLGHPVHPMLVQAPVGAWLSASMVDLFGDQRSARRLAAAGLTAAVPAAVAGTADWSEQHEQQMRVGVVHAAANLAAMSVYGASLLARGPRLGPRCGWPGWPACGERAGGRSHLVPAGRRGQSRGAGAAPGRARLASPDGSDELPEGKPVREMLGEVPVVAVRAGGAVYVLADRCSHMSGPLSGGELAGRLPDLPVARQRVPAHRRVRGPRAATAPQPAFQTREVGGAIQVCLPGAG